MFTFNYKIILANTILKARKQATSVIYVKMIRSRLMYVFLFRLLAKIYETFTSRELISVCAFVRSGLGSKELILENVDIS